MRIALFVFILFIIGGTILALGTNNQRTTDFFAERAIMQAEAAKLNQQQVRELMYTTSADVKYFYDTIAGIPVDATIGLQAMVDSRLRLEQRIAAAEAQQQAQQPVQPAPSTDGAPVPTIAPLPVVDYSSTIYNQQLFEEYVAKFPPGWGREFDAGYNVQCVGGVKFYLRDSMGITPQVWAPNDNPALGYPPFAIRDYLNNGAGIFPVGPMQVGTNAHGLQYSVQPIPRDQANALEVGDVIIFGQYGQVGHTAIFAGYPDNNPESSQIIVYDMNGTGSHDPWTFRRFGKDWLNHESAALRVVWHDIP